MNVKMLEVLGEGIMGFISIGVFVFISWSGPVYGDAETKSVTTKGNNSQQGTGSPGTNVSGTLNIGSDQGTPGVNSGKKKSSSSSQKTDKSRIDNDNIPDTLLIGCISAGKYSRLGTLSPKEELEKLMAEGTTAFEGKTIDRDQAIILPEEGVIFVCGYSKSSNEVGPIRKYTKPNIAGVEKISFYNTGPQGGQPLEAEIRNYSTVNIQDKLNKNDYSLSMPVSQLEPYPGSNGNEKLHNMDVVMMRIKVKNPGASVGIKGDDGGYTEYDYHFRKVSFMECSGLTSPILYAINRTARNSVLNLLAPTVAMGVQFRTDYPGYRYTSFNLFGASSLSSKISEKNAPSDVQVLSFAAGGLLDFGGWFVGGVGYDFGNKKVLYLLGVRGKILERFFGQAD